MKELGIEIIICLKTLFIAFINEVKLLNKPKK